MNNLDDSLNYFNSLSSRPIERCKRITDKLLQLWLLINYDLRFNQLIDYVLKDSTIDKFYLEDDKFEQILDKLLEQYKYKRMKFKLNDSDRVKLLILLSNDTKFNTISTKLLHGNEIELTDEEVTELILLGLKLND